MMRFVFGICLLAVTLIVGTYSYFENAALIANKAQGVLDAQQKVEEVKLIMERAKKVFPTAMQKGNDKKSSIERLLQIGDPGLSFSFTGQPLVDPAVPSMLRYTFRVEGGATFSDTMSVLTKLKTQAGFVVYHVCYGCGTKPTAAKDDTLQPIMIDGYLYVFDSSQF